MEIVKLARATLVLGDVRNVAIQSYYAANFEPLNDLSNYRSAN